MIELRDISLTLRDVPVFASLSLSFDAGSICGIIGPAGAGKSMLLSIIAGSVHPQSGQVLLGGLPLPAHATRARARAIAVCNGARPGNPHDTVREFLLLARIPHKKFLSPFSDYDYQVVDDYLDAFGLRDFANETLGGLSGCTLRKAGLAHAFIGEPDVLLLDDPTSGLDMSSIAQMQRALSRFTMRGKRIAVAASNDLNFIAQTADRAILLSRGAVALDATPEALDAAIIKKYFNADVLVSRNIYNGKPEFHLFPAT